MLNYDSVLFPHHIDEEQVYVIDAPAAKVFQRPDDPRMWGLRNLSDKKWVAVAGDAVRDVPPGDSVPLATGIKIHFGTRDGEVRLR
jgi:hypothetical protein